MGPLFRLCQGQIVSLRPSDYQSDALQLSYLSLLPERRARPGVPCLVRHRMRHAILSFPVPRVPNGRYGRRLLDQSQDPQPERLEPSATDGPVAPMLPLFDSHLSSFRGRHCLERTRRGPQHSPSVLGAGLGDQPSRSAEWHDESRLAWRSLPCERAAGMGARPFHDVTAA